MSRQKKYKKLTNKEKQLNKEIRAEMRDKGRLPPIKPKLNRKKFAKEVIKEFEGFEVYHDLPQLISAISWMLPPKSGGKITPEQVGVLKVLKLAIEINKFKKEKLAQGETQYNLMDMYDKVVAPVRNL